MNDMPPLDQETRGRMESIGIDVDRSSHILSRFNAGAYDAVEPLRAQGIPEIDGKTIIDRRGESSLRIAETAYRERLGGLAPEVPLDRFGRREASDRVLSHEDLRTIGVLLYPYVSFGVLNGGSASSYADTHKNESYDERLFELYRPEFESRSQRVRDRPKGITPAFFNPDGSDGPSFLELKFRMVMLAAREYRRTCDQLNVSPPSAADGGALEPALPFVEMTSIFTEEPVRAAYRRYRDSPILTDFPETDRALDTEHAVQPLLAAMTHSEEGRPKRFFLNAWGESGRPLGIPGGHGQNFQVMAEVYRGLRNRGKRFVYLGNVDNTGFTIEPVSLAIMAMQNKQAGFDFSFKTPVDVKGGILVYDRTGGLNCGDIGPAVGKNEVFAAEESGKNILFNCASGVFSLDYLVPNLDYIVEHLPMRISDQNKDAGKYSQAEQVTWEIIGMLDDPIIFGVDKYRRFLAAKMILDTFLTSGLERERAVEIQPAAAQLADGLATVLRKDFAMELRNGRWVPAGES